MYTVLCDGLPLMGGAPGIGRETRLLSAALSEEVNTAGKFVFTLPPEHVYYNHPAEMRSDISVRADEREIFFGRAIGVEKDFYNRKTVTCEGALAFLNDSIIRPYHAQGISTKKLISELLAKHNAAAADNRKILAGNIEIDMDADVSQEEYNTALSELKKQTADRFGGYFFVRRSFDSVYLDYTGAIEESLDGVRFGVNLLDLQAATDTTSLCTCLIPLGENDTDGNPVTIKTVNGGADYIENTDASAVYGRIWRTQRYDGIVSPDTLLTRGRRTLAELSAPVISIDVNAIEMDMLPDNRNYGRLQVGHAYKIRSQPHNIEYHLICISKTTDLLDPKNDRAVFGCKKMLTDYI